MKLEEEIKQSKFRDEHQKMVINLMFTTGWVNVNHIQFFREYGISPQQYNILRILKGQYPMAASVNLLIERMLDKMSNASRLVDKLVQKGLVERKACKSDRRQVDVLITAEGLKVLQEINERMEMVLEPYKTLSVKEAKQLNDLLDKLRG